jgi:hypothetical protein
VVVLRVAYPSVWSEIEALVDLEPYRVRALGPLAWALHPRFAGEGLALLRAAGLEVLERQVAQPLAAESAEGLGGAPSDPPEGLALLLPAERRLLARCQRRAVRGRVFGATTWDPVADAALVDSLVRRGLLEPEVGAAPPRQGPYRVAAGLPAPPPVAYPLEDAAFPAPEDLRRPDFEPLRFLDDLAVLVAAVEVALPRRNLKGALEVFSARRLGKRLGDAALAREGQWEAADPRWARAWRTASALGLIGFDPVSRRVVVEPAVERVLAGSARERLSRLLEVAVDPALRPLLPVVGSALVAAGTAQAIDELILVECLEAHHRDVLFSPWGQPPTYPAGPAEGARPYDAAGFRAVEARLLDELLQLLYRLGYLRRGPGCFGATPDGLVWAGAADPRPALPVWITSDGEVLVPPLALDPPRRRAVERLSVCLDRDQVDRLRLSRPEVVRELALAEVDALVDLLRGAAAGLPAAVEGLLRSWAEGAGRVVLEHGRVLAEDTGSGSSP